MDAKTLLQILGIFTVVLVTIFGALFTVIWFSFKSLIKSIQKAIEKLTEKINQMELDLANSYAKKDDFEVVRQDGKKSRSDLWQELNNTKDRLKTLEILSILNDPKAEKAIKSRPAEREDK